MAERTTPDGQQHPSGVDVKQRLLGDDGAQLFLDVLKRAEDERLVVRAPAPQEADERLARPVVDPDGRAAVTAAHDRRATRITDEALAELHDLRAADAGVHARTRDRAPRPAGRATHLVDDGADWRRRRSVVLCVD